MKFISYSRSCKDNLSTSKFSVYFNGLITKVVIFELFLNRSSSSIVRDKIDFIVLSNMAGLLFTLFWMLFQNQKTTKEFDCSLFLYNMILSFLYTIFKHFKWIMFIGPAFINASVHKKTLKIITRKKDFGIPTLEIFLNKNKFGVQLALYKSSVISTKNYSYCRYSNQVIGSMNECSVCKKPHLICNLLICSKVSCFDVKCPR